MVAMTIFWLMLSYLFGQFVVKLLFLVVSLNKQTIITSLNNTPKDRKILQKCHKDTGCQGFNAFFSGCHSLQYNPAEYNH